MHTNDDATNRLNLQPLPSAPSTPGALPEPRQPKRRGFAAMDPAKVSEIARKGGKAAHAAGTAHEFTADEARAAGRKGGLAPHTRRGTQKLPEPEKT
ncbi:MAG TPA: KGG domain-containing protein [Polyangiaceae bacterium]|nr:KGG domain-containing protein [Polyangiaceae bacterium]